MNIFHQTLSINYFQYEKTGPPPLWEKSGLFSSFIFLAVHKERTLPFRKNASPLLKFFIINETADSKSVLRGEYLNE